MKVVIQCAAGKRPDAGSLHYPDGQKVVFVAQPEHAPPTDAVVYARPDDAAYDGRTWREHVLQLNSGSTADAPAVSAAYQLYANETYRALADRFGFPKPH